MGSGDVSGRLWPSGKNVLISWEDGRITTVEEKEDINPKRWIAPTLFDLQVNGFGGIDFQRDGLSSNDLTRAAEGLRNAGCTRFLLTLITDGWERMLQRLRHFRALREDSEVLHDSIVGWHFEGPFLSPEAGYRGAHDPERMMDPSPQHIGELHSAVDSDPILLTLAPERSSAIDAIREAASRGMKVSLGHCNPNARTIEKAVAAGSSGFTHFGNATPQELDRHDNLLWRIFDRSELTVGLIPDALHVSPSLFRLVHRAVSTDRIYYTTDAMSAAGAPPGSYTVGSLELEVGADRVVRHPGQTNFAGSALRPIEGIIRATEMLNCTWQAIWKHFSILPARFMGIDHSIAMGNAAEFCVIDMKDQFEIEQVTTFASGSQVGQTVVGRGMESKERDQRPETGDRGLEA